MAEEDSRRFPYPPIAGVVPPRPRTANRFQLDGQSLVSVVPAGEDIKAAVRRATELIGGLGRLVRPGDAVLLKPNLVRDYPPPVSTALDFLRAVVELLREAGAGRITVGEHTGNFCCDTKRVFRNLGYYDFAEEMGVELVPFEDDEWLEVRVNGRAWPSFLVPRTAYEAKLRIYLPSLKTHSEARYTNALKLPVGCTHLCQRHILHGDSFERRVAELNLAWQPDLIITDGRKSFVTQGPSRGDVVEPGLILASGDPIAIDVEGVRVLQSFRADNLLNLPAWETPVIAHAIELRLGARSDADVTVVKE